MKEIHLMAFFDGWLISSFQGPCRGERKADRVKSGNRQRTPERFYRHPRLPGERVCLGEGVHVTGRQDGTLERRHRRRHHQRQSIRG